jgi:phage terminase large subunit GpA-like protein
MPEQYFHQLCSESKVTEWNKNKKRQVWKNTARARNEALDTFVYGLSALHIARLMIHPTLDIEQMMEHIAGQEKLTLQTPEKTIIKTNQINTARPKPRRRVISKGVRIN